MEPGIVIPIVVIMIVVPLGFLWANRRFKDSVAPTSEEATVVPSARLTSGALRELPHPPWRVVFEIAETKLGGADHVVIGPPGVFVIETSMDPLPDPSPDADATAVARAAISRGPVDDALRRCGMGSDRLVRVYWGANDHPFPAIVDLMPGVTAVDGRSLAAWAEQLEGTRLTASQVDLAWQTVTTAIGRPDPLG